MVGRLPTHKQTPAPACHHHPRHAAAPQLPSESAEMRPLTPGGRGGRQGAAYLPPPPGPASAIVSAAAHARLNGERRHRSPFVQNERLKELRKNVATNVRSGGRPWRGEPQGGCGRVNSDQKNAPIYSKHRTRSRDFKGGPAGASCVCLLAAVAAWCCCCCLQIAEPLHDAGTALLKTPLRWGFYFFTF